MLNENKLDYEVINLGVSGYGTDQELILLQKEGLKYNPDVVILGFYLENDIPDNSKELLIVENGELIKNEKGLFKIKKYLYKSLLIMKGNSLIFSKFNRFGGSIVHTAISTGIYPHIPYYGGKIFEKEPLKYLDDNLEKTEIILKEIKKICDKNNISLIILMIPSVLEKNSEGNTYFLKSEYINSERLKNNFNNFFNKNNFTLIDLYTPFINKEENLYLKNNIHWNKEGQLLAANITYNFLKELI